MADHARQTYRPLPQPPAADGTTTVQQYGLRLIAFLLDTGCTVTLSDDQLAAADHAIGLAVRHPYALARTRDRLAEVQREIAAAIARRASLEVPAEGSVPPASCSMERPNLGPMAPLSDRPIVRPPSGQRVNIQF